MPEQEIPTPPEIGIEQLANNTGGKVERILRHHTERLGANPVKGTLHFKMEKPWPIFGSKDYRGVAGEYQYQEARTPYSPDEFESLRSLALRSLGADSPEANRRLAELDETQKKPSRSAILGVNMSKGEYFQAETHEVEGLPTTIDLQLNSNRVGLVHSEGGAWKVTERKRVISETETAPLTEQEVGTVLAKGAQVSKFAEISLDDAITNYEVKRLEEELERADYYAQVIKYDRENEYPKKLSPEELATYSQIANRRAELILQLVRTENGTRE